MIILGVQFYICFYFEAGKCIAKFLTLEKKTGHGPIEQNYLDRG